MLLLRIGRPMQSMPRRRKKLTRMIDRQFDVAEALRIAIAALVTMRLTCN